VARSRVGPLAAFGVFWGTWDVLLPDVKQQAGASVAELNAATPLDQRGRAPTSGSSRDRR